MAFDLAREVSAILERVQTVLGHAVAEAKGKPLSGPALRLNAVHQDLLQLQASLKATPAGSGAAAPTGAAANPGAGGATATGEAAQQGEAEPWGSAFHDRPPPPAPPPLPPDPNADLEGSVAEAWSDEAPRPTSVPKPAAPPARPSSARTLHNPTKDSARRTRKPDQSRGDSADKDIWEDL
jgi:hypothetical protein